MVVTEKKNLNEIVQILKSLNCRNIAIIGCGSCATLAGTGGEKEVEELSNLLKNFGFSIAFKSVIDTACHERLAIKSIKEARGISLDCFLVLSCGSGVQNIADVIDKPVIAGLNTVFIGKTKRPGIFLEYCQSCGDCILSETGGICPKTRCPKGVLNGPCGGMHKGKCEVDETKDCIWVKIHEKLNLNERRKIRFSNFEILNRKPRSVGG
ncbi:MAG: methylenetetrahydrofolate reductase C-terminal domain-containing protein [Actinobacteria bacterium]|nr:methylenetetrahydrofolate reductase C-terminal domain-containing protein [Actinomycetota bacterium]